MEWGNRREIHSQVASITAAIQKLKVYYAHTGATTYAAAIGISSLLKKTKFSSYDR